MHCQSNTTTFQRRQLIFFLDDDVQCINHRLTYNLPATVFVQSGSYCEICSVFIVIFMRNVQLIYYLTSLIRSIITDLTSKDSILKIAPYLSMSNAIKQCTSMLTSGEHRTGQNSMRQSANCTQLSTHPQRQREIVLSQ